MFVILGALAGSVGSLLKSHQTLVNVICGLIVIFFGLNFLGVFKLNLFRGARKAINTKDMGFLSSLLFGMIFSIG